jgi:hypothetical protein
MDNLIGKNVPKHIEERMITIHSNDRDVNKWLKGNEFELKLPEIISNIQSVEITDIYISKTINIFSDYNQNTKLSFTYGSSRYTMKISSGNYLPDELANEIQNRMNIAIGTPSFVCKYHKIQNKIWFSNTSNTFILHFNEKEIYDCNNNQKEMWNEKKYWGLGSYLGYKKMEYTSSVITLEHQYAFIYQSSIYTKWVSDNSQFINPEINVESACLQGEKVVYLEIEKYNTINELTPFALNTSSSYNNSYNGKVNTAFTKIILDDVGTGSAWNNTSNKNKITYNQLVKNIDRLKFKLRYHSGLLVDLADTDVHFTLIFYTIKQSSKFFSLD